MLQRSKTQLEENKQNGWTRQELVDESDRHYNYNYQITSLGVLMLNSKGPSKVCKYFLKGCTLRECQHELLTHVYVYFC